VSLVNQVDDHEEIQNHGLHLSVPTLWVLQLIPKDQISPKWAGEHHRDTAKANTVTQRGLVGTQMKMNRVIRQRVEPIRASYL
jgi:hypothetical protein